MFLKVNDIVKVIHNCDLKDKIGKIMSISPNDISSYTIIVSIDSKIYQFSQPTSLKLIKRL